MRSRGHPASHQGVTGGDWAVPMTLTDAAQTLCNQQGATRARPRSDREKRGEFA